MKSIINETKEEFEELEDLVEEENEKPDLPLEERKKIILDSIGEIGLGKNPVRMFIQPEQAKGLLKINLINRTIADSQLKKLVRNINEDKFQYITDGIGISEDYYVMNGQHRLTACFKAKKPIEVVVVPDLKRKAFSCIDTNKNRNLTHTLEVNGIQNSTSLSGLTKLHFLYNKDPKNFGVKGMRRVENEEGLQHCIQNQESFQDTYNTMKHYKEEKDLDITFPTIVFFFEIAKKIDREDAIRFIDRLIWGHALNRKSPILGLRNYLSHKDYHNWRRNNTKATYYVLEAMVRTWNMERNHQSTNKRIEVLKTLKRFPELI